MTALLDFVVGELLLHEGVRDAEFPSVDGPTNVEEAHSYVLHTRAEGVVADHVECGHVVGVYLHSPELLSKPPSSAIMFESTMILR